MNWIILLCMLLNDTPPAAAGADRPTVIVVMGAEGAPEYAQEFGKSADGWADAAKRGSARFVQIGRDESAATATTDKERLKALLDEEMKNQTQPLWLVFIGHGTSNGQEAKFNLRGPDVSDHELAQWLAPCHRPLAFIDCSSASAPFLNRLSGPGRVIITATQSGQEIQFSRFGDYLSAAIADPAADLDKDGQTSLLEAFLAASHQVDEFFKQDGRIVTEHALLDDNGDGKGIAANWFQGLRATQAAKDGVALDGARAHQWHLVLSAAEQAMPPELRVRRDELELKIETLRSRKSSLPEADYYAQLDELFLQLAKLYQK
jgi:hypothetical protein